MKKQDAAILAAGVFWGLIGLFTRYMGRIGIDSAGVLIIRSGGCAVLFLACALIRDPKLLRIRLRDLWLFFGYGVLATFFFTYSYYRSIDLGSLAAACTLLYSAPVFVMVMSLFIFHERLTGRKATALVCALAGCCLVSGVLEGGTVSAGGTVYGLMAGVGYALYSVFSKALSNRGYHPLTINAYGWCFCVGAGLLLWGPSPAAPMLAGPVNALVCVGIAVISGFLPALLYSWGLSGVEAGRGAVLASVEPVVACLLSVFVFRERLSVLGLIGIVLVLGAVIVLNTGRRAEPEG